MANERNGNKPRFSEPTVFSSLFMTGFEVEVTHGFVRIVGWEELPLVGYDGPERRIIARIVMSNEAARDLIRELVETLGRTDN